MNIQTTPPMDKVTFYRWLERQERRHELVDGTPRMQPFVTSSHWRIQSNLVALLLGQVDREVHDVGTGDFAIETGDRSVRFADVMVCPLVSDPSARSVSQAVLLIEVQSASTTHVDFGPKLTEYGGLNGLDAYLICAQERACCWLWKRDDQDQWPADPEISLGLDATVRIGAITLPLSEIYRRVPLR